MSRRRINRCGECKEPLKHIHNNQWMCDQSPSNCKMSIKVIYLNNPADEEVMNWEILIGSLFYLYLCLYLSK